jgi:ZIP family zinc transporter
VRPNASPLRHAVCSSGSMSPGAHGPLHAAFWGLVAGSALVLGAFIGWFVRVPARAIAAVMAFGSGVLISALSFELMDEAYRASGLVACAGGFLFGAALYTLATWLLARHGAKHRKRSGGLQPSEAEHGGSGLAIAAGALLDGIPESIVIGISLLRGGAVSMVTVVAIFLSNLPEGLSSAAGMKRASRTARYVFCLWIGIALLSGAASWLGYVALGDVSSVLISAVTAVAAGAILTMLVDTMIPEAFEEAHAFAGIITVIGFLVSFGLSKLG